MERKQVGYGEMEASNSIELRPVTTADLDRANAVVEAAIWTWGLPDRVKRLSLPSYRYNADDLNHFTLIGAWDSAEAIVGIAAWESAIASETPNGARGLLMHGIYVVPDFHRKGVGTRLLNAAIDAVNLGEFDGLLVKANPNARAFFTSLGLQQLPIEDTRSLSDLTRGSRILG